MIEGLEIRESMAGHLHAIEELYREAFPTEDLLPLVRELLDNRDDVLSLVATVGPPLIANVIFTKCSVDGHRSDAALLGPLAVASAWQQKGIGSLIISTGLRRLQDDGIGHAFVLGDPAYYGRFGFSPEAKVAPADPLSGGMMRLPAPWLRKELWVP